MIRQIGGGLVVEVNHLAEVDRGRTTEQALKKAAAKEFAVASSRLPLGVDVAEQRRHGRSSDAKDGTATKP